MSATSLNTEAKIHDLCSQISAAHDDEAVSKLLPELRDAIHEHCEILRLSVARDYPFQKNDIAAD